MCEKEAITEDNLDMDSVLHCMLQQQDISAIIVKVGEILWNQKNYVQLTVQPDSARFIDGVFTFTK